MWQNVYYLVTCVIRTNTNISNKIMAITTKEILQQSHLFGDLLHVLLHFYCTHFQAYCNLKYFM